MSSQPDPVATVERLLEEARSRLARVSPAEALAQAEESAVLVDIRSEAQRARDGTVAGSKWFPRNVLEWRLDPSSPDRDPEAARRDVPVIVMCDEGYQSSLAAATLRRFGLDATDVIGGFQAWRAAGLPVEPGDTG
jgi:rhodanese-related sulfurtransferase